MESTRPTDSAGASPPPNLDSPETSYERRHRYLLAARFAQGKTVLDIACGDGSGAYFLASVAEHVVAIAADTAAAARAQAAYHRPNLEFRSGPAAIPNRGEPIFDVVVALEPVTHPDDQQRRAFIGDIKRLLTDDGIVLISAPVRAGSTNQTPTDNSDRNERWIGDEIEPSLRDAFGHVQIFGQNVYPASYVWRTGHASSSLDEFQLALQDGQFSPVHDDRKEARHLLAVCSDHECCAAAASLLLDLSEQTAAARMQQVAERERSKDALSNQGSGSAGEAHALDTHVRDLQEQLAEARRQLDAAAREADANRQSFAEQSARQRDLWELAREKADLQREVAELRLRRVEAENADLAARLKQVAREHRAAAQAQTRAAEELRRRLADLEQENQRLRREAAPTHIAIPASPHRAEPLAQRDPQMPPPATVVAHADGRPTPATVLALPKLDVHSAIAADVIVCVHNALDDVKLCLASLVHHTAPRHRIILVDDGSDAPCREYLVAFARAQPRCTLLRNDVAAGYTRAANRGLAQSTAAYAVLLNSDTIVTPGWLEKLLACGESDPRIGVVGPLSNAATYQSVPTVVGADGGWATNAAPPGWDLDLVADLVDRLSPRAFPRVPFVNGFCFAIKRVVIDAVGPMDEAGFPDGYGEENDYCLRAAAAGFQLAIADQAYVYHAGSRSYADARRHALTLAGAETLRAKHGADRVSAGEAWIRDEPQLAALRHSLGYHLQATCPPRTGREGLLSVLFLLPASGANGGVHSVVLEAGKMRQLGIRSQVAIPAGYARQFQASYPKIWECGELFYQYHSEQDLIHHASQFDVVVGTIYVSMATVKAICQMHPWVVPAYYVQDYEPWFSVEHTEHWHLARESYTLVPRAVLFAKTRWLCDFVHERHGVELRKVAPGVDTDLFSPGPDREQDAVWPKRVTAMIRPSTPRRGAARTMRVLRRLKEEFAGNVELHIFGCQDEELDTWHVEHDFSFASHGELAREQVAELLRRSDIFIDLSDWQAFGSTAVEAMSSGCAVIVPAQGGTGEYAVDRETALVVDTSREDHCYAALRDLIVDGNLRRDLRQRAVQTAMRLSVQAAATSEIALFLDAVAAHRRVDAGAVADLPGRVAHTLAAPSLP